MNRVLHVLHVDADHDLRQIVALSLALDPAVSVTSAASAAEALAFAADPRRSRPGLVLLDARIGAEDGVALLAAVRDLPGLAAVPAVFLTGRLCEGDHVRMLGAGARAVLRKPFDPLTLAEDLRDLLVGRG